MHTLDGVFEGMPEWGREYAEPAFAGNPDAALSLVAACHDYQRAALAHSMYAACVELRALREARSEAWTQTHRYRAILSQHSASNAFLSGRT
jgi:hypothetical protein